MREEARARATQFVQEQYAAGRVNAERFGTVIDGLLAADSETQLAQIVRSLPQPVAFTDADRRLAEPLEIHSGTGRLHLTGRWQIATQTHISADLGSIRIDVTEAEFDDRTVDLHVFTGWGSITIIVPRGVEVQVVHHRGRIDSRLEPPIPGLPLIRLDVTTNIGRVRLRHPRIRGRGLRRLGTPGLRPRNRRS